MRVSEFVGYFLVGLVAGGEGFEPSTPNLGGWCSIRTELLAQQDKSLLKPTRYTNPSMSTKHFRKQALCSIIYGAPFYRKLF